MDNPRPEFLYIKFIMRDLLTMVNVKKEVS